MEPPCEDVTYCLTACLKRLSKQTHSDSEMEFLRWFLFCNHVPSLGLSQGPRDIESFVGAKVEDSRWGG
jgi:hypothetical protein